MVSGRSIETEGGDVDQAIEAALAALALPRERVRIEILRDARKGVLGLGIQRARVRVTERGPSSDESSANAEASDVRDGETVLRTLLALMGMPAAVQTSAAEESEQLCLIITSPSGALLIGRHGQTLDALEFLVNRIAGRGEEGAPRYLLDVEGYRARRFEELRETARRFAARARTTGRPQTMAPMRSRERRVVHVALRDEPSVTTHSDGEGALRHVVIAPVPRRRP